VNAFVFTLEKFVIHVYVLCSHGQMVPWKTFVLMCPATFKVCSRSVFHVFISLRSPIRHRTVRPYCFTAVAHPWSSIRSAFEQRLASLATRPLSRVGGETDSASTWLSRAHVELRHAVAQTGLQRKHWAASTFGLISNRSAGKAARGSSWIDASRCPKHQIEAKPRTPHGR
jgi:hypothetical protein